MLFYRFVFTLCFVFVCFYKYKSFKYDDPVDKALMYENWPYSFKIFEEKNIKIIFLAIGITISMIVIWGWLKQF